LREAATPLLRPRMPELDALRGVAVLMVVGYHGLFWSYTAERATGLARLVLAASQPGWLGVELFFVLSGFLITGILLEARQRPDFYRWFYRRRALRILPLYGALLGLLLLVGIVRAPFAGLSLLFMANLAPLLGVGLEYGPFWSLAVEEQFYLAWPAAVRRLSRRDVGRLAWGVVIGSPLVRLVAFWIGATEGLFFYTWFTLDGLAMGALLALFLRQPAVGAAEAIRLGWRSLAFAGVLVMLGAPFGILTRETALGAALQYSPACLAFTGLVSLALAARRGLGRLMDSVLCFFGEISYGLYLVHLLAFMTYDTVAHRFAPDWLPPEPRLAAILVRFVVAGTAATLVATVSRRTLEAWFLARKGA
jgi:peptidoglycan/LPS O-acetylase OafA/YrhL